MRVIPNVSREAWLARRNQGIGASDAPILLGLSKYKSPFQLFHEKLGLEPENPEESEAAEWGLTLEGPLAARFVRDTGREVVAPEPWNIYQHQDLDWMLASIDRWQKVPREGKNTPDVAVLELKTANWVLDKDWKDEAPIAYQVQVQHQMAVTGASMASIAALIGGQKFVWTDIPRDEDFINQLIALEAEFWQRCLDNRPPPIDDSEQTGRTLRRLYAKSEERVVALGAEFIDIDDRLQKVKEEAKALVAEEQGLKNKFMEALGTATIGQLPNGTIYTFREVPKKEYVVKASTSRQLRRKAEK